MIAEKNILSRMRRGAVEAFLLQGVSGALLLLMHTVLARNVSLENYGLFTYALTLSVVLAVVVPLGWPTAVMRFISQYVEQQRWGLLRGVVTRAYQFTFLSACVAALLLWGVSYLEFIPPDISSSMRLAALLLPFTSFMGLRRKALQGLQRVKASIVPEGILLPLVVISAVLLFSNTTALGITLIYASAALLAFLLGSSLIWRGMPSQGRLTKPEFETRAWIAVSLPMVFGGLNQAVINQTDVLFLGALTDDMEAVGVYGIAVRIALLNTFVMMAISAIAAPMMSAAFHGERFQQVRTILRRAMIWSALGALPLFVAAMFLPRFVLGFFGPEFVQGAALLQVLAFGQFVNAATGPVNFALLMTGRERTFAYTMGAVALGTVAGHLILIPAFGALGAACVTATSVIVLNGWQLSIARRARLV